MQETTDSENRNPSDQTQQKAADPVQQKRLSVPRLFVAGVLVLLGTYMLSVSGTIYFRGLAALNYKMVDATVSGIEEFFDPFGLRKEASMSYVVDGKSFTANAPIPEGRVLKKGEATVVFCDSREPNKVVLNQEIDYDMVTVMGAFGLFALSFGSLVAFKAKV